MASEAFLTLFFAKVNLAALHAKRATIQQKDVKYWKQMVDWDRV